MDVESDEPTTMNKKGRMKNKSDHSEQAPSIPKVKAAAATKRIQCPNCGRMLVLPKQFENDYYLTCNICNQQFANPTRTLGRGENYLKKNGCLIFCVFIAVVVLISYFTYSGDSIKADATTVYVITKDIYAPSTEDAAKAMINSMAQNGNDPVSNLDHMYKNDADFTHVFANDKVVVLKKTSSGAVQFFRGCLPCDNCRI